MMGETSIGESIGGEGNEPITVQLCLVCTGLRRFGHSGWRQPGTIRLFLVRGPPCPNDRDSSTTQFSLRSVHAAAVTELGGCARTY